MGDDNRRPINVSPIRSEKPTDNLPQSVDELAAMSTMNFADGRLQVMEVDYAPQVDEALPKADNLATTNLAAALDLLAVLEKQTRLGSDMRSNFRILQKYFELSQKAKEVQEKVYTDIYWNYVVVRKDEKLTMDSIYEIGVTCRPWERFTEYCSPSKRGYDSDKYGMILVAECSNKNLPPLIRDSRIFGRVGEYILFDIINSNSLRDNAKPGDGKASDPVAKRIAKHSPELKIHFEKLLFDALNNPIYVDSMNIKFQYECQNCLTLCKNPKAAWRCCRDLTGDPYPCSACEEGFHATAYERDLCKRKKNAKEGGAAFGDVIQQARTSKGLSMGALAKKVGVDKGTVLRYEQGLIKPSLGVLEKLEIELSINLKSGNIDTICKEGVSKSIVNKPSDKKPEPKPVNEEEESNKMMKYFDDNESLLRKYAVLKTFDQCEKYLLDYPHLCSEFATSYLNIKALDMAVAGRDTEAKLYAGNYITLQYLLELAKSLHALATNKNVIKTFFKKIRAADETYMKMYHDEVDAFKERLTKHAKTKSDAALTETESKERDRCTKESPGRMDPQKVSESLPEVMQKVFDFESDSPSAKRQKFE